MNADQTPPQRLPRPWEVAGTASYSPEMQAALDKLAPHMILNPDAGEQLPTESETASEAAQFAEESLEIAEQSLPAFNEALAQVEAMGLVSASVRPDAGRDEGCGADGCTSFGGCGVCGQEAAFEAGRGSVLDAAQRQALRLTEACARADAAEARLRDAERIRFEVEKILDTALGSNEEDGAGLGLVGDVALLAERKKAAEARLAIRTEHFEGELSAALAQLKQVSADLRAVQSQRDDAQRAGLRIAEQRDEVVEMVKQCTGHPDRANPDVPSHPELIQQANAERDEARAKLDEIRAVFAEYPAAIIAPFDVVERIRAIVGRPAAAPAEPREEPARAKTLHADYCARADNHDGDCEAPDWYLREEPAHDPAENCYCGGPEEIYPHRRGTRPGCRARSEVQR